MLRYKLCNKIYDYLKELINNQNNYLNCTYRRPTSCRWIATFRDDNCFDQLLEKFEKYETKHTEGQKLFLHRVLTHGNLNKEELYKGKKRSCLYALTEIKSNDQETIFVYNNTLRYVLLVWDNQDIYKRMLCYLIPKTQRDMKTIPIEQHNIHKGWYISFTTLLWMKVKHIQLALYVLKQKLEIGIPILREYICLSIIVRGSFMIFCVQSGYKVKLFNNNLYIPINEYQLRENDDDDVDGNMALCPIGSQTMEVCSRTTFLRIWNLYLPNLKIKSSPLDTCNLCNKYPKL